MQEEEEANPPPAALLCRGEVTRSAAPLPKEAVERKKLRRQEVELVEEEEEASGRGEEMESALASRGPYSMASIMMVVSIMLVVRPPNPCSFIRIDYLTLRSSCRDSEVESILVSSTTIICFFSIIFPYKTW